MNLKREFGVDHADTNFPILVTQSPASRPADVPRETGTDGINLYWKSAHESGSDAFISGEPIHGAIWEFLELRDANAESILSFAKKYGVLGLRENGLPITSPFSGNFSEALPPVKRFLGNGPLDWWHSEPLAVWRNYAVSLRALIAMALEMERNPQAKPTLILEKYDLQRYGDTSWNGPVPSPAILAEIVETDWPDHARERLAWCMTEYWIRHASIKPVLSWRSIEDGISVELRGTSPFGSWPNMLFSVLASQFMSIITTGITTRIDQCSYCGKLFVPEIKPGRHTRSFCPEHKLEGERDRKRRWARKKAAEKRAQVEG